MKRRTKLTWVLVFVLLAGWTGYHIYLKHPDPYQHVKAVRDLNEIQNRLTLVKGRMTLRNIGEIQYPSFKTPMWAVCVEPVSPPTRRCLLVGGVHGNEPAGTETLLRFIEQLSANENAYPDTAFDIIPVANPWGWVHNRRRNYERYDLNRDFAHFYTQETRLIRDFLRGKRYDIALDLHEDGTAAGFYLYQYAEADPGPARDLIAKERAAGYSIAQEVWMVVLRSHDGLIRAPMWTLYFVRAIRTMSIGNIMRLDYSGRAYTLETPSTFPMEKRVDMDMIAIRHFLSRP
ncbi:MAG TPA: DUF2817 domain-containing protein [Candidatus Hydrogenedentes bacterium]|nr:DUF2817 domain-containing protein [Candidatus Hydrogenedentota bacterium]